MQKQTQKTDLASILENPLISFELQKAYDYIEGLHTKTPVAYFDTLNFENVEVELWAKLDSFNEGGSFKDRGSAYAVHKLILDGKILKGDEIVTASAGNHAKGVARAAKLNGLTSVIFMAEHTPKTKIEGTLKLGAKIILVPGNYSDAAREAIRYSSENNKIYIPAYEDANVIIGQSTVFNETIMQLPSIPDFFVSPFGGGGLSNGGGLVAKHYLKMIGKKMYVFGVQSENFNTMVQSYSNGAILPYLPSGDTIADGIKVPHASEQMLRLSLKYLDGMFDVTEEQIKDAIKQVYRNSPLHRLKEMPLDKLLSQHGKFGFTRHNALNGKRKRMNIVEGASAAAFAAVFNSKLPYARMSADLEKTKLVGVVIASGNNIDESRLKEII